MMFISPAGIPWVAYAFGASIYALRPSGVIGDPWTASLVWTDPSHTFHSPDIVTDGREIMVVAAVSPLGSVWSWSSLDDGTTWSGPAIVV